MATNAEQIVTQAPAAEIAEEAAATRPRDETGKFVSPDKESEAAPVKAVADDDAAPQGTEATGEDEKIDPEETPPLDLPRSWAQDAQERWTKLDRETQQYLLDHDSKASETVRRAQNEAAEARKSV